jgi:hypothetical protein
MEEAKRAGLARSIGISNSGTPEIEEILSIAEVVPAVNQVRVIPQINFDRLIDPGTNADRISPVHLIGSRANLQAEQETWNSHRCVQRIGTPAQGEGGSTRSHH